MINIAGAGDHDQRITHVPPTSRNDLQAERLGAEIVPRDRWLAIADLDLEPPVYLSLDLDVLDPAFAPGVSRLEPGGLSSREVMDIIWALPGLVGADIVELNPSRDAGGMTAYLAAKLVKELVARMLDE